MRTRRTAEPGGPVTRLLHEIRELGCAGSANLLVRYLDQGGAEGDRPVTTPRRLARLLLTHPEHLRTKVAALLSLLTAACPEMTALACPTSAFAALLTRPSPTTASAPSGSPPPADPAGAGQGGPPL
ncbi:hypothetical protein V2S66_28880 [Streptomyces sp. V4-01]|uniref:Uncharacterized protein n=1 Tax=Actinacidiphila polyblastidii TaxID=3110430 RepID=A0ABU7PJF8_9ACTN|nr:hypothetical protein [Streptomyces sp. V4-01]